PASRTFSNGCRSPMRRTIQADPFRQLRVRVSKTQSRLFLRRGPFAPGGTMTMLQRLWSDEAGFIVSSELVLIASIAVIGLIAGLTTVRDQVVSELADVANAIGNLNQSYSYSGLTGHSS